MDGDRQRTRRAACWLHQAPPQGSTAHTHSLCTAAHTAQADRFDIRKRSGWLVVDDDGIRMHSHDSTGCALCRANG